MLNKVKKKGKIQKNSTILINNLHPTLKLPISHKIVKESLSKVMGVEDCRFNEIIVNFVNNRMIRKLNSEHLNHDYFTDIITFPYNNNSKEIEGELFISLDTVKNNGKIYGTGFKQELQRVIIHGALHLTGYKDKSKSQKELIRKKENFYLSC